MDLFNKTKGTLLNAGKNFSQKASNASGAVAVSMRIREAEKSLEDAFKELGKACFEYQTEEIKRLCPEQIDKVQTLLSQIDKDKKELAVCKGMQICPNCGAEQPSEAMCCTMCGMNMNEAKRLVAEQRNPVVLCAQCGAAIDTGSRFCPNCGAKRD